jgi:hypothetical protein
LLNVAGDEEPPLGTLFSLDKTLAVKEEEGVARKADLSTINVTHGFLNARSQARQFRRSELQTIVEEVQPYLPVDQNRAFETSRSTN